jgi:hypothetical protein
VVREAILAEELECSLHPPDGRQLSVELDKAYACTDRIDGERATKVKRLSWPRRSSAFFSLFLFCPSE